jgi:hypothetical protein
MPEEREPSDAIEREITQLEARRAQLEMEEAEAAAKLEAARTGLVEGGATVAEVTSAQSLWTGITEAVKSLVRRMTDRRAQLAEARAIEARRRDAARLEEIKGTQARLTQEFNDARVEADKALERAAARMCGASQEFAVIEQAGRAIEVRLGHKLSQFSNHGIKQMPLTYGQEISLAFGAEASRRDRAARKARAA